ncbi:unnamed protein product [Calypogeia fissa]
MSERGRGEREGLHCDHGEDEEGEGGGGKRDLTTQRRKEIISAAAIITGRGVGDFSRGRDQLKLESREEEEDPGWDKR